MEQVLVTELVLELWELELWQHQSLSEVSVTPQLPSTNNTMSQSSLQWLPQSSKKSSPQSSPQSSLQSSVQSSPQWSLNQSVSDSVGSVDLEVSAMEVMVWADTEVTVLVWANSEVWEWEDSDSDTEDLVDSEDSDTESVAIINSFRFTSFKQTPIKMVFPEFSKSVSNVLCKIG